MKVVRFIDEAGREVAIYAHFISKFERISELETKVYFTIGEEHILPKEMLTLIELIGANDEFEILDLRKVELTIEILEQAI
jgi:hypothetical protein